MTPFVYLPTLERLGLALAIGLFVGLEREHRRKEAGLRTFGCIALIGAVGALLGEPFAIATLGFFALAVVLLNVQSLRANEGLELTTSAALFLTGLCGILCGYGHSLTPAALAVVTAALLAWKEPMAGFSKALTDQELRSAIALAILAFVVYPALPAGAIDRWNLVEPQAAWLTVLFIAGLGFANYVLLKLYGTRGVEMTGFLGGIVNSTVTVAELARRDREADGALERTTFRGVLLATAAMIVRNGVLLAVLAFDAFLAGVAALAAMAVLGVALAAWKRPTVAAEMPPLPLESPFSVKQALHYGVIFLVLQIGGSLAQRELGELGFYAVSLAGGFVSSASAVASAGAVAAHGDVSAHVAGIGAVLATLVSAAVNWPIAARVSGDRVLARRLFVPIVLIVAVGLAGALVQRFA